MSAINDSDPLLNSPPKQRLENLNIDQDTATISRGYTKFVLSMRWALPLLALGLMAVVLAWPKLDNAIKVVEQDDIPSLASVQEGSNELINPRYETTDSRNNPVNIRAQKAIQSSNNADLVRLENPAADFKTETGDDVNIAAQQGTYDQKNEKLFLQDDVKIKHASNYQLEAEELRVNLKTQEAFSKKNVQITGPDAKLEAQGMEGKVDEGTLLFEGPALLTLYPKKEDNTETEIP